MKCEYDLPLDMSGWNVVDIGANVGVVSLLCAERGAWVTAFEPEPENFKALLKNTKNTRNIEIRNYGIGDSGLTRMCQSGGGSSVVSEVISGWHKQDKLVDVEIRGVGEIFVNGDIDLLKVDCEGSEYDIFDQLTLQDFDRIKMIIIEFHPYNFELFGKLILKLINKYTIKLDGVIGYLELTKPK